jgi:UTP--glucose-1-phosphate uridylyltransferase
MVYGMIVRKAVVPAAGLGTRLLPATKELPKEMLPIFLKQNNEVCLKPMLQVVFEQLYDFGFREFGFVVGRGKRAIEDHFTIDEGFVEYLKGNNKVKLVKGLRDFYQKIGSSSIVFVNQPKPKGFGDAVYYAKSFTGNEPFLVHAGDDLILSNNNDHLRRMIKVFENYDADAVFLVEEVEDAQGYGVMVGKEMEDGIFKVEKVVEKPRVPPSNLAVIALYIFKPIIYRAIEKVFPDEAGEVQLTDGISFLLNWKCKVYALKLKDEERRMDIGSPENYFKTLTSLPPML